MIRKLISRAVQEVIDPIKADFGIKIWLEHHLVALESVYDQNLVKTKKLVLVIFGTYLLSIITFSLYNLANNLYKHKCYDGLNNFLKSFTSLYNISKLL